MSAPAPIRGRTQAIFWIGFVALVVAFVYLFKGVLLPFVAGMAIAYALDPLVDRLERTGIPRAALCVLVIAGFFGIGVAAIVLVVPVLYGQLLHLINTMPDLVAWLRETLLPWLQRLQGQLPAGEAQDLGAVAKSYAGDAAKWMAGLLARVWTGGLAIVNLVSLVVVTPVVAFYLLNDWDRIVARINDLLPHDHAGVIREQVREMDQIISAFVRGAASVAIVLAVFYGVSLSAIGLNYGLVVGIGAGLISFIPFVGAIAGVAVALALALFQFDSWTPIAMVAAVFIVGQMLESNVLTPRLVGERIGLHPVWVVFALLGGGLLFGFLGVLLAVPAAAVIGVLVRFAIAQYRQSPLYRGSGTSGPDS
jgi:predicted PurR-regulated permease PerM